MKRQKRKFTAAFKAQVALAAIQERESVSELAKRFELQPAMISQWKREFINRAGEIFSTKSPEKQTEQEMDKLYAKIGQLEMERDFLKKVSQKLGL